MESPLRRRGCPGAADGTAPWPRARCCVAVHLKPRQEAGLTLSVLAAAKAVQAARGEGALCSLDCGGALGALAGPDSSPCTR